MQPHEKQTDIFRPNVATRFFTLWSDRNKITQNGLIPELHHTWIAYLSAKSITKLVIKIPDDLFNFMSFLSIWPYRMQVLHWFPTRIFSGKCKSVTHCVLCCCWKILSDDVCTAPPGITRTGQHGHWDDFTALWNQCEWRFRPQMLVTWQWGGGWRGHLGLCRAPLHEQEGNRKPWKPEARLLCVYLVAFTSDVITL